MYPSRELVVKREPSTPLFLTGPASQKELTIRDLIGILLRRKLIILSCLALFIGGTIIYCTFATRRYEATGEVQIQKETADGLGLDNTSGSSEGYSDALDANINLQTQARVLQSDSLALQVIKELNLERNEDFLPKYSPIGWVLAKLSPAGPQDLKDAALEDAPARRTRVLKIFRRGLEVKPVSGTRLIDVSYLNSDPRVAADVVNHVVEGLIDYNFQTRHNATQQVSGWLGNQLSDLRKQSEDLQAKVVELQRDSGLFTLGQTDTQGREQVYTPVLDRLQQATAQLAQAQSSRIMKGALYQVVKNGDPELISGLSGSGMLASAPSGVVGSLSLIQNLRAQEATTQAQLNELSAKFGPGYSKLDEVKANLETIQSAIHAEATRVAARVKNDYSVAEQVENNARTVFLDDKQQADALNDKTIEYEIAREEATQSRTLYENLLGRLKEADLLSGLRSSNITLVDPARVPSRPAKPNVLLYMASSVVGGLFIGMCGALLRNATDTKIQDLSELEAYLGEIPFGILPYHKDKSAVKGPALSPGKLAAPIAVLEPHSAYTEAVRTLRTSLMRGGNGSPPKVVLVTSSVPGEGKSRLSVNLSILLAQQGKKVLLVDGDLRTPGLHRPFNLRTDTGLSTVLAAGNVQAGLLSATVSIDGMPGLDVMAAGPLSHRPAELLDSPQMKVLIFIWRKEYDFIIIDAAPVLPVTDSVILSTHADLTLVVARYKMTQRQSLRRTCSILQSHGTHKIGLVLNAVERSAGSYRDYYGYSECQYYGRAQNA